MIYRNNLIRIMILCVFVLLISSCNKKDELKKDIKIVKLSIDGVMDFDYMDSLTYAAVDTIKYRLKIITEPTNAIIYYKTGLNNYIKLSSDWISVDSTINKISFYADLEGYNKTQIKSINFAYNNDSLISRFDLYPNPSVGQVKIGFNTKTRGILIYKIYNILGLLKLSKDTIVSTDSILTVSDISSFENGIYILKLNYGETTLTKKLVKQ